jgi:peroxiredoxin
MKIGNAAPDVELRRPDGQTVRLSHFWQRQPVVLVFVRHLG